MIKSNHINNFKIKKNNIRIFIAILIILVITLSIHCQSLATDTLDDYNITFQEENYESNDLLKATPNNATDSEADVSMYLQNDILDISLMSIDSTTPSFNYSQETSKPYDGYNYDYICISYTIPADVSMGAICIPCSSDMQFRYMSASIIPMTSPLTFYYYYSIDNNTTQNLTNGITYTSLSDYTVFSLNNELLRAEENLRIKPNNFMSVLFFDSKTSTTDTTVNFIYTNTSSTNTANINNYINSIKFYVAYPDPDETNYKVVEVSKTLPPKETQEIIIEKEIDKKFHDVPNTTFLYKIQGTGEDNFNNTYYTDITLSDTLYATKTIEIPKGEYIITEINNLRYSLDSINNQNIESLNINSTESSTIKFISHLSNDKGFSSNDIKLNNFSLK